MGKHSPRAQEGEYSPCLFIFTAVVSTQRDDIMQILHIGYELCLPSLRKWQYWQLSSLGLHDQICRKKPCKRQNDQNSNAIQNFRSTCL